MRTPGNWRARKGGLMLNPDCIATVGTWSVGTDDPSGILSVMLDEPDAKLMAASPRLLESLRDCFGAIEQAEDGGGIPLSKEKMVRAAAVLAEFDDEVRGE